MSETSPEPQYDPADHTVAEVQAHLDTVTAEEFARIVEAETFGKSRTGVLTYTPDPDKATPDEDGYTRVVVDGYPAP